MGSVTICVKERKKWWEGKKEKERKKKRKGEKRKEDSLRTFVAQYMNSQYGLFYMFFECIPGTKS